MQPAEKAFLSPLAGGNRGEGARPEEEAKEVEQ